MSRWVRVLAPYVGAAVGSSLVAAFALQLWNAHLGIPLSYSGDSLPHAMHLQQIIDHGWFWSDARLGAPFKQHFQDWPLPEVLPLWFAQFFALFTSNWAVIMNAIFLISFPLAALSACWVLREFGVSRWSATPLAILYSVIPYHFVRGEDHLFLSCYFMVPFGIWLAVKVLLGHNLLATRRATARTVLICVVLAMSGVYYAVFTLLFVVIAAVLMLARDRKVRALIAPLVVCLVIGVTVIVDLSPALMYHRDNGANLIAADRQARESDLYGLKLAQMLMPANGHRIDAFDDLQRKYYDEFPIPSEAGSSALGFVGSVGLLYLFVLALLRLTRPTRRDEKDIASGLAALAIPAFLIATVGGISTFISLLVFSEIRSWNRISIFLGFIALAAVGYMLDAIAHKWSYRWMAPALAAVVFIGGVGDQTTQQWKPQYKAVDAAFLSDQSFFQQIESAMQPNAQIYELPRAVFPESAPIEKLGAYDLLKPYLHTNDLQWSFAGVKGRFESEWQSRLSDPITDARDFIDDIVGAGFSGVYIDRNGYADHGKQVEEGLSINLALKPFVSNDGSKSFYDLRGAGTTPEAVAAAKVKMLFPAFAEQSPEFYAPESDETENWWWAKGADAKLPIFDADSAPTKAKISFDLQTSTGVPATFQIKWPDGSRQEVSTGSVPVPVSKDIDLKKGRSEITIDSDAQRVDTSVDPRELHFRLIDIEVAPQ